MSDWGEAASHSLIASVVPPWVVSSMRTGLIGVKCNLLFFAGGKSLTKN